MMESFFKTLKYEEVNLCGYEMYDIIAKLPHFIEEVCNRKRLHSAFGYHSPNEFEELLTTQEKNAPPHQPLLTMSVQF